MNPIQISAIPEDVRTGKIPDLLSVVPLAELAVWCHRLYTLINLAWQYVDTICDVCIQMKLRETRPLVRDIRALKREYDIFRSTDMSDLCVMRESETGVMFEDAYTDDFRRLYLGLENEVAKLDLKPGYHELMVATYQALTIMDAAFIYARRCDDRIREYVSHPVPDYCMVQQDFIRLRTLVPQFGGDCYKADIETRKLTASILANRIESLEIDMVVDGRKVTM